MAGKAFIKNPGKILRKDSRAIIHDCDPGGRPLAGTGNRKAGPGRISVSYGIGNKLVKYKQESLFIGIDLRQAIRKADGKMTQA